MEDFTDNKREKENTIIFVEGISDLAFLSLLMNKWKGYTYVQDYRIQETKKGMKCSLYTNQKHNIIIFSVGGIENFNLGYNLLSPLIKSSLTKSIVMIIDNDLNDEEKIIKNLHLGINVNANKWVKNNIKDDYEEDKELNTYIKIIPENKTGALETVLIEAIKRNEDDIASSAVNYIDNLNEKESKYISKRRLKLKAKTGVIFNLISPDKTFDALQKKFELIDVNGVTITECFGFLKSVI